MWQSSIVRSLRSALLLNLILGAGASHAQFVDATSGALVGQGGHGAWIDVDNDGDLDLYLAGNPTQNGLFRNDGGVFTSVPPPSFGGGGFSEGQSWGDYDTDGDLDLYLTHGYYFLDPIDNGFYRNDGYSFSQISPPQSIELTSNHPYFVTWLDYDRDGDVDAYVVELDPSYPSKLYRNDRNGAFVDVTAGPLQISSKTCWGDYDNDGDLDVYMPRASSLGNNLLRNDGGGVFVDVTSAPINGPPSSVSNGYANKAAWGDYDDDGNLDLCVVYESDNGTAHLYLNSGDGTFTDATSGPLLTHNCWDLAWGDYDNDGDLDLFLGSLDHGDRLLRNDGPAGFVDVSGPPLTSFYSTDGAWGDYDHDGDLDLRVNMGGSGAVLRNDLANGNHWLQVDLRGTTSNRFAIGARVRVVTNGRSQIRDLGPQDTSSRILQFGLGTSSSVDALLVTWPSGVTQLLQGLAANQRLQISEPVGTDVTEPRISRHLALHPNVPNPFNPQTTIAFDLADAGSVSLLIHDAAGRLVRTLTTCSLPAGHFAVTWDGTNDARVRVASGVYTCTLRAGGQRESRNMTLLK